jgi:hypothetical protein
MMAIADTVNSFFTLVETGGSQDIPSILKLFVDDNPQPPGPPNVGLTSRGPHFQGQTKIDDLFTTLNNTFGKWAFDPAANPPVQLTNGNMIAVEMTVNAKDVKNSWYPNTVDPTPPLSKIPQTHNTKTSLPVCAVFTMDPQSTKIINLALYFDRWKLGQDLWDKAHPPHIDK